MFLEVKEYGAKIGIDGGKLTVKKDGCELACLPLNMVESVSVHTSVQISSQAVSVLSKRGVRVSWTDGTGMIICSIYSDNARFSSRRRGQYNTNNHLKTG